MEHLLGSVARSLWSGNTLRDRRAVVATASVRYSASMAEETLTPTQELRFSG